MCSRCHWGSICTVIVGLASFVALAHAAPANAEQLGPNLHRKRPEDARSQLRAGGVSQKQGRGAEHSEGVREQKAAKPHHADSHPLLVPDARVHDGCQVSECRTSGGRRKCLVTVAVLRRRDGPKEAKLTESRCLECNMGSAGPTQVV